MSYIHMEHLLLMFLDHTQLRSTIGRTPLDEWSARRRDLYLTTHDTHNRQISIGVGHCIPFTMYNHCMISLSTFQLHRHHYSLSKSIEFVNFINEFRCLVIRSCLLIGQIPCFSVSFLSISLCCWSRVQWYSKWSVVWSPLLQGHVYVCMYVCMYVCVYVCMYVCIHACIHVCIFLVFIDNMFHYKVILHVSSFLILLLVYVC